MKVKCITNQGKDLSPKTLEEGYLLTTDFQLTVGDSYFVYGISLWRGILHYLTMDRHQTLPDWHPAELFVVTENLLPLEWYFRFYNKNESQYLNALWGYRELVLDDKHYEGLIERDNECVRIFLKHKTEVDEY